MLQNSIMETEKLINKLDLIVVFPRNGIQNSFMHTIKKVLFSKKFSYKSDLLESILQTDVGLNFSDIYIKNEESKLFEEIKTRNKSINYYKLFRGKKTVRSNKFFKQNKKINRQKASHFSKLGKCNNQVHTAEIQESFRVILHKIIPKKLIGIDRNRKKILKTLHNLLLTAKSEPFTLIPLLGKLNISSITWIMSIDDHNTRYILLAKFIKWLFQYFITVMWSQFHIAYIKEERIFIHIQDWKQQEKMYLQKMTNKMALEPVGKDIDPDSVKNKLYFIPKSNGIRSIAVHKYEMSEKLEMRKSLCILRYLYETVYCSSNKNFSEIFIKIIREVNNKKTLFMISSDIRDAYGSIKQEKLFNIVESMFENLPDNLILQWYESRDGKKYKYVKIIKNSSTSGPIAHQNEFVKKEHVLQMIKKFIFHTRVRKGEKVYYLCKGIAQGLMLSAMLCNIYYADMRKKIFSDFVNAGHLFTYVDDSIYITRNLRVAKQYLEKIQDGIPEYNCWFNKSKQGNNLRVNEDDTSAVDEIEYLGWKINSNSFEVEPKYDSARYSTTYFSITPLKIEYKLKNLACLKLDKLSLCKEVNSKKRIFDNIKTIFIHQAERCFALVNSLCKNQHKINVKMVEKSNSKILKKIENLTRWDKREIKRNRTKLRYIMWKSFLMVFSKKSSLCKFKKELMRLTKKYTRKKSNSD